MHRYKFAYESTTTTEATTTLSDENLMTTLFDQTTEDQDPTTTIVEIVTEAAHTTLSTLISKLLPTTTSTTTATTWEPTTTATAFTTTTTEMSEMAPYTIRPTPQEVFNSVMADIVKSTTSTPGGLEKDQAEYEWSIDGTQFQGQTMAEDSDDNNGLSTPEIMMMVAGTLVAIRQVDRFVKSLFSLACSKSDPRLIRAGFVQDDRSSKYWGWFATIMQTTWLPLRFNHQELRDTAVQDTVGLASIEMRLRRLAMENDEEEQQFDQQDDQEHWNEDEDLDDWRKAICRQKAQELRDMQTLTGAQHQMAQPTDDRNR